MKCRSSFTLTCKWIPAFARMTNKAERAVGTGLRACPKPLAGIDIPDTGGHSRTSLFGKFDAPTVEIFISGERGHNSPFLIHQDFWGSPSSTGIDSSVTPVARRDAKCGELRYFAGLACRYHGKAEDSSRIHVPRPSERDRHAMPVFEASSRSIPPPLRRNVQPPANHFVTGRRLHSSPISRPSSRRQSFEAGLRLPFGVGTPYMLNPVRSHSSRTAASCPASV